MSSEDGKGLLRRRFFAAVFQPDGLVVCAADLKRSPDSSYPVSGLSGGPGLDP